MRVAVLLLLVLLAALTDGWPRAMRDVRKNCPSRCECDLSETPQVVCRGLFSLPGSITPGALSFRCVQCPIARMSGRDFQNYTGLTNLSLEGSSHPIFDEQSLEFLRSIPNLELEGYELTPSDLLFLADSEHTLVLRNISLVTPATSPTAPPSVGGDHPPPVATGDAGTTVEAANRPHTTQETSDNRIVGGGLHSRSTRPSPSDDKGSVLSTTTLTRETDVPKVKEESLFPISVIGISVTVLVVLTAAFSVTAVCACSRRKETQHVEHAYTQIKSPNTLAGSLKKSLEKATAFWKMERS